jgi:hypothetical protein
MEVHIQEVIATVRSVSADSLLTQRTLEKIVHTVLGAVRAERTDEQRKKADRRITSGARDEQEGEAR